MTHEAQRDHIDAALQTKTQVVLVLGGDGWCFEVHARQIYTLRAGEVTAPDNP